MASQSKAVNTRGKIHLTEILDLLKEPQKQKPQPNP